MSSRTFTPLQPGRAPKIWPAWASLSIEEQDRHLIKHSNAGASWEDLMRWVSVEDSAAITMMLRNATNREAFRFAQAPVRPSSSTVQAEPFSDEELALADLLEFKRDDRSAYIVTLLDEKGISAAAIARKLGVQVPTVLRRADRQRARVKAALQEEAQETKLEAARARRVPLLLRTPSPKPAPRTVQSSVPVSPAQVPVEANQPDFVPLSDLDPATMTREEINRELFNRRAAGESAVLLADWLGLTPASIYYRVNRYQRRVNRLKELRDERNLKTVIALQNIEQQLKHTQLSFGTADAPGPSVQVVWAVIGSDGHAVHTTTSVNDAVEACVKAWRTQREKARK